MTFHFAKYFYSQNKQSNHPLAKTVVNPSAEHNAVLHIIPATMTSQKGLKPLHCLFFYSVIISKRARRITHTHTQENLTAIKTCSNCTIHSSDVTFFHVFCDEPKKTYLWWGYSNVFPSWISATSDKFHLWFVVYIRKGSEGREVGTKTVRWSYPVRTMVLFISDPS